MSRELLRFLRKLQPPLSRSTGLTALKLSCGAAPGAGRHSGTTLAATNDLSAGSVCKRRDAAALGRKKGLQPRANERPAGSFSFELGRGQCQVYITVAHCQKRVQITRRSALAVRCLI